MNLSVESIREAMAQARPVDIYDPGLFPAGVMLLVYPKDGELCVLLNKRSQQVEHHKGEISFPGGAKDPEDATILDTALRETDEEMGVHREDVDVLGRLDQVSTGSRFSITPFVGAIQGGYAFKASNIEVAEVLEVPLPDLLNAVNGHEDAILNQQTARGYAYSFGEHVIFGATARILTQFLGLVIPVLR